jgi:hypothetical protein
MRKLAHTDLSYHFLQNVRGSPAFFNKMLYDLLGMIRRLGTCKLAKGSLFCLFLKLVQINCIFTDNVRILYITSCFFYLQCQKVGKLVRFKQKGQKQASFLAFHKCCQGCLLRGPRYISTSFILCKLTCLIV